MFLFQNSCVDRSDVLLTNMNSSMLGQAVQEVRESQNKSTMQPIRENMNLVQNMSGEDEKEVGEIGLRHHEELHNNTSHNEELGNARVSHQGGYLDAVNSSLSGPAASTRLHNCNDCDLVRCVNCIQNSMDRCEEDEMELMRVESRVRSLSSPDLVTEGSQSEWEGGLEDGLRRRGEGGAE